MQGQSVLRNPWFQLLAISAAISAGLTAYNVLSRQTTAHGPTSTGNQATSNESDLIAARVNSFYEKYQAPDGASVSEQLRSEFLTEGFQRELAREDAASKADPEAAYAAGIHNADPFTLAQDDIGNIHVINVQIAGDQAEVTASYKIQLKVVKRNGKWLIDNISTADQASAQGKSQSTPNQSAPSLTTNSAPQDTFESYRRAAETGNAEAQLQLGILYYQGKGVARNLAEAARWYRKAADQGNAYAQSNLGALYHQGDGVTKDFLEAAKWLQKAAKQGEARAQLNLGAMYYKGDGVTKDLSEAAKWYQKAAEQDEAQAQINLGGMYYKGDGVTKDFSEAAKWMQRAAEQGDATAQVELGLMYCEGAGVAKNFSEAIKWYQKAADQSDARGQRNLGIMYLEGYGVVRDRSAAIGWLQKAAEQGEPAAIQALRELKQ
jgi:TPR repeat protein